jgi:DNA adenine methylase
MRSVRAADRMRRPLAHLASSGDRKWSQRYTGKCLMPVPISSRPAHAVRRPPLKWAGGKRWQVPYLRLLWTPHAGRRLVEPFCGGLAVTLGLSPACALLNDANPHLINFYRWLQVGLSIDLEMENDEASFYRQRDRFNSLLASGNAESREAAGLFYYLNRTGFNGLCRFNRTGEFNVPFGRYTRIGYARDFTGYRETFAPWTFTNVDVQAMALAPGDFVYADPPYDVEFTQYAKEGFSWVDQERTAVFLAKHPGPVVLVNQATARIDRLYRTLGFAVQYLDAPRRISCTGDRTPAREIVATLNL